MSAELLWEGRPHNKIRWEFRDRREFYTYLGLSLASPTFLLLAIYVWGSFINLAFLTSVLTVMFIPIIIFRHPWRAFRRRKHKYKLTSDAAYIERTNMMGMPVYETYPITPEMNIELVERSGLTDVYFGRRIITTETTDGGTKRYTSVEAGFELIPNGRAVYLKMLELQLEVVKNGRP